MTRPQDSAFARLAAVSSSIYFFGENVPRLVFREAPAD
jgi:hypothetical protein